jgi:hypothetical protein
MLLQQMVLPGIQAFTSMALSGLSKGEYSTTRVKLHSYGCLCLMLYTTTTCIANCVSNVLSSYIAVHLTAHLSIKLCVLLLLTVLNDALLHYVYCTCTRTQQAVHIRG